MSEATDIVIIGGGIAGKIAACAFGQKGYRVQIIEGRTKPLGAPLADLRSTAFLTPACDFFRRLELWEGLLDQGATPLREMRIIEGGAEAGQETQGARCRAQEADCRHYRFSADEMGQTEFGWNIANQHLHAVLDARLERLSEQVVTHFGVRIEAAVSRSHAVYVRLSDGTRRTARLLIGADGRASQTREIADISTLKFYHGQKALAFRVTHERAHENVSTEIYERGGPFTLVPMPALEGVASSAVIWMDNARRIAQMAALDEEAFNAAATLRSRHILGGLTLVGARATWSVRTQIATRPTAQRIALIGEALHLLPPIGAQGLNMTIADIDALLPFAGESADSLGDGAYLTRYSSARGRETMLRSAAVAGLNMAAYFDGQGLGRLRKLGLGALGACPPLKRKIMGFGMGL